MSHAVGTYLGAVRNLTELRGRCVMDRHTACWHFRDGRGRPIRATKNPAVFVHQRGKMSARLAAWTFRHGPQPVGTVVWRTCASHDCVNPQHLKAGTRVAFNRAMTARGVHRTARKTLVNTIERRKRATLTAELARWARESTQSGPQVAHALEVRPNTVNAIRRGVLWRETLSASVFSLGGVAT